MSREGAEEEEEEEEEVDESTRLQELTSFLFPCLVLV